jgi:hypothetical protein
MNKRIVLVSLFLFLAFSLLFGCAIGTSTDLSTGQKTDNKGLSFEETYLTVDGVKLSNNEVQMGKVLKVNFDGITGFNLDSNKLVRPGMSMQVVSVQGEEILFAENLLSNYTQNGLSPLFAASLNSTLTIGNPMKIGESYEVSIRIWDDLSENEINSKITILVVE